MSNNFAPSPTELALVGQIFSQADPQKLGVLTGDVAVRVFGGAKLSPTILGEIWSIADEDNNGWLPKKGVAIAVRLMGWAQKGEKITQSLVNKPGPLPTIEGVTLPIAQSNTGVSLPRSPPPSLPPLTPQDKAKFQRIFNGCGPVNGLLSGDKARDVFVKSKLPVEKLLQIWTLADTQDRGALDATDFVIGMYLIQASMSGQLTFIPSSLPPMLHDQAAGVLSNSTGGSGSFSPISSSLPQPLPSRLPHQHTGPSNQLQPDNTGSSKGPPLPARSVNVGSMAGSALGTGQAHIQQKWDVTPTEKANSDQLFDKLDHQKRGYIEGDVAVPFMLDSKLDGEILAQVWDLADINNDGRLTRDGFAVAMHLIQSKLAGKDIPTSLPPTLVPPSMHPAVTNGSPFSLPPQTAQEPARDLLLDDSPPMSATASQSMRPGYALPTLNHYPPVSSNFAASSTVQSTSANLLDDDDGGMNSVSLHDSSAEIGNVSNQLNSTNRSLDTAKSESVNTQQALADQAAQLSSLQTQLSSAKAAFETETKLLATLRERHSTQNTHIQKARQDLIHAESDLSAVRVEKTEVEGAFLRDKEETRDLNRKMIEVSSQVEQLKASVERAKKEAKQQKGLLAIARKQFSTKEAERAKVATDLELADSELAEVVKEKDVAEAELAKETPSSLGAPVLPATLQRVNSTDSLTRAASHALPTSPDPSSPSATTSPGVGKSNNPFERLQRSASLRSQSSSPFQPFADASFSTNTDLSAKAVQTPDTADPFGVSHPLSPAEPAAPFAEEGTETLPSQPDEVVPPAIRETPAAPGFVTSGSDDFSTPVSVTGLSDSAQSPVEKDPATTQFTALDVSTGLEKPPTIHTHYPALEAQPNDHGHTDLDAQLKELDISESESDSDEEDSKPLAELVGKSGSAAAVNGAASAPASFDDAFGITESPPAKSPSPMPMENALPLGTVTAQSPAAPEKPVEGVDAFDEAMGKISPTGASPTAPPFTLESTFEDNFDFASASQPSETKIAAPFPPVPTAVNSKSPVTIKANGFDSIVAAPDQNGSPVTPSVQEQKTLSFDDAFGSAISSGQTASIQAAPGPSVQPHHGISFDDAFSGDAADILQLHNPIGASPSAPPAAQTSPPPEEKKPFPSSPSAAAKVDSPAAAPRSTSPPPQPSTPTHRVSSPTPRPRPSTSSSKDSDKPKDTTRHSKLSIRLPFGRKKKQESHPPPPQPHSQFLSPLEEPQGADVPAVDDDVDAVKQLCSMGFSRTQAVDALEKHGYDMSKALNSLLAQ